MSNTPEARCSLGQGERRALAAAHLSFARTLARRRWVPGLDEEDLVGAAFLGLVLAARDYDPERGSFRGYAELRIRRALGVAVASSRLVRLPPSARQSLPRVMRARAAFTTAHGRDPDRSELAAAAGVPLRHIEAIEARTFSLDAPVGGLDESGASLHELLPDACTRRASDAVCAREVGDAIDALPSLERDAVRGRWLESRPASALASALGVPSALGVSRGALVAAEQRGLGRLARVLR